MSVEKLVRESLGVSPETDTRIAWYLNNYHKIDKHSHGPRSNSIQILITPENEHYEAAIVPFNSFVVGYPHLMA